MGNVDILLTSFPRPFHLLGLEGQVRFILLLLAGNCVVVFIVVVLNNNTNNAVEVGQRHTNFAPFSPLRLPLSSPLKVVLSLFLPGLSLCLSPHCLDITAVQGVKPHLAEGPVQLLVTEEGEVIVNILFVSFFVCLD